MVLVLVVSEPKEMPGLMTRYAMCALAGRSREIELSKSLRAQRYMSES